MAEGIHRNSPSVNRIVYGVANFKPGKIATVTFFTLLFFTVISIFVEMHSGSPEIVDLAQFTEYYEKSDVDNGGLELVDDIYYTFERKYNLSNDLKTAETTTAQETGAPEAVAADTAGAESQVTEVALTEEAKKVIPEAIEYEIKKGDTLDSIAKAHNVTREALVANNPVLGKKALKIGDKIHILPENGMMYKIVKGDPLYKIAQKFKIKVDDILAYNDVNAKNLKIGQSIFIKNPDFDAVAKVDADKKKDVRDMKLPKGDKNINIAKTAGKAPVAETPEEKAAAKKSAIIDKAVAGAGVFRYPVTFAGVASPFGNRFHPVLRRYMLHTGVDLVAKYVPLKASRSGKVSYTGYMGGYGKVIVVKHPDGYETRYAHLSAINTKVGAEVRAGQLIGKTGQTGRVTGPHLHFEIRKDGQVRNPMKYLKKI